MAYLLLLRKFRNLVHELHRCLVVFEREAFSKMGTTDVSSQLADARL